MTPVSAYLAITALDGLVASGCVGLAIALCATMFSRLALLAKVAVIAKLGLHSLFLMQMFLFPGVEVRLIWDVLHLALVGLYTFSRVTSAGVGRVDVLEWAFIAWAVLGHLVDFGGRLGIQWWVVPRLFERYLEGFDGEAFRDDGLQGEGQNHRYDDGGKGWWWHRVRLTLGWGPGLGRGKGYRYHQGEDQDQFDGRGRDGMPVYGRAEQHLLGDIERQV
jgi:hypothetical protein